jgi:hypothetical protein
MKEKYTQIYAGLCVIYRCLYQLKLERGIIGEGVKERRGLIWGTIPTMY